MSDKFLYQELSERSIAVSKWFGLQSDLSLSKWRRLINTVIMSECRHLPILPCPPVLWKPYSIVHENCRAHIGEAKRFVFQKYIGFRYYSL